MALILWVFSIPLALGSLYAFIPAAAISILLVARIAIEEKSLQEELSGYKEYCAQTPYRLIPYIW